MIATSVDLRRHDEPLIQLALAFDPPKEEPGSMAWVAVNERAQLFHARPATFWTSSSTNRSRPKNRPAGVSTIHRETRDHYGWSQSVAHFVNCRTANH